MKTNIELIENEMIKAAIDWLRSRLPENWEIDPTGRQIHAPRRGRANAAFDLKSPDGMFATVVVEAKKSFSPRDVDLLLGGLGRTLRDLAGNIPILVVSQWLSDGSRNRLRSEGINYIDLTGNSLLRLDNPAVFIETAGAFKDPYPLNRGKVRLQGPRAARVVRNLVDVRPPFGVRELAAASEMTPGYVSRLLTTLDAEALIERTGRGRVISVDIDGLIRRWASSYDIFRTNRTATYLAPLGASRTLGRIDSIRHRTAVTGSFAAARIAPVAGPALLVVYCDDPAVVAKELELIPTDEGANVALLEPFDPIVWERTSEEVGIRYVAPSQVAVDCLTGNGRMPAEGEAILQWLIKNEDLWRQPTLSSVSKEGTI